LHNFEDGGKITIFAGKCKSKDLATTRNSSQKITYFFGILALLPIIWQRNFFIYASGVSS